MSAPPSGRARPKLPWLRRPHTLRVVGAIVVVSAALVYLTISHELALASVMVGQASFTTDAQVEHFLRMYRDMVVTYSMVEYASLVVGLLGLALMLAGPHLLRLVRGEMRTPSAAAPAPTPTVQESGRLAPTSRGVQ